MIVHADVVDGMIRTVDGSDLFSNELLQTPVSPLRLTHHNFILLSNMVSIYLWSSVSVYLGIHLEVTTELTS